MKRVAWVRNSDDAIIKRVSYSDDWDAADVAHKFGPDKDIRIIPINVDPIPVHDDRTQAVVTVEAVLPGEVRFTRSLRPLTQDELDDVDLRSRIPAIKAKLEAGNDLTQQQLRKVLLFILTILEESA